MSITHDKKLRLTALELAVRTNAASCHAVQVAKDFYTFLKGDK
jgi:hypothetical protein